MRSQQVFEHLAMKNLGLVLSGGGARGAWQIGIWKALRELGLDHQVGLVVGTSVGALNGAFFAAGQYARAVELWESGDPSLVFDALAERGAEFSGMRFRDWILLAKDLVKNRGLQIEVLKRSLRGQLEEEEIRRGDCQLGFTVYNYTLRQGAYLWARDTPEGQLWDYLLASAAFPLFQPYLIGQYRYLDGGLFDLTPVGMAFQSEIPVQHAIVADVSIGSKWLPRYRATRRRWTGRLTYIRPSQALPAPVNFSSTALRKMISLGHADGLRVLSNLHF